jgi:hypothetical protein
LVVAALSLTVLLGAAGLAIDMGYLRYQRRRMQTAADSAAIAGASQLSNGTSGDIAGAADHDASLNGFTNGVSLVTVTASSTAINCPDGTAAACVQVIVSQPQPLFFMKIFGTSVGQPVVSASAIAKVGNSPNCMYGLGSGDVDGGSENPGGINTIATTSVVVTTTCGIVTNGTLAITAPSHFLKALSAGGQGGCTGACGNVTPAAQTIVPPADPLSYLTPPSAPSNTYPCGSQIPGTNLISGQPITNTGGPVTLPAGSYPCGIQIAGNANVNFAQNQLYVLGSAQGNTDDNFIADKTCGDPNIYPNCGNVSQTIKNANEQCPTVTACTAFSITGDGNQVTGQNVTFYNQTGSIYICVAGSPGGQSTGLATGDSGTGCISNPANEDNTISLSAETAGGTANYPGILFYQDPNNHSQAVLALDDASGGSYLSSLEGALYFPGASLTLADMTDGANWQSTYTILVGWQINLAGTVNLGNNYSLLSNQSPIKDAVLVQ